MKRSVSFVVAAFVVTATVTIGGLVKAQTSEKDCVVRDDDSLHSGAQPTKAGHYPHEEWIANPAAQRVLESVNGAINQQFGQSDQANVTRALDSGLVGLALDHFAQEIVVLVDPSLVDESDLEGRLRGIVQRAYNNNAPFALRVGKACNSASELHSARDVLGNQSWHARANEAPYSFYLDPNTSTYHVTFSASDADIAAALEERLGDAVEIEWGVPQRDGRLDDGEPHYGGAGIRAGNESQNSCTSGFTVVLSNGNKGSVTAGHCYNNGQNIYSGPQFYGETQGESGFPTYDMIRIHPNGETFTNKIHVDPCCPDVRTVTEHSNPALGAFICISGMVTRAKCGLEVKDTNATLCSGGCTPNLFYSKKPGDTIRAPGDSGAPLYIRPTTTTAGIKGIHIGGGSPDESYAHKISTIKSHLNISVSQS